MTDLFKHQVEGVEILREAPYQWLADKMGLGKTRQVITAAELLAAAGEIDRVIVITPAAVRGVWFDPEFGQLSQYVTQSTSVELISAAGNRGWLRKGPTPGLSWYVTNYELVRRKERLAVLKKLAGPRTLLVLDESIHVSNPSAAQTKACWALRLKCGRVWILNGTEGGGDTPGDLYAQAKILSPEILGCKTWSEFKARYAKTVPMKFGAGRTFQQIVEWINLEDLWRRLAPYYLRRTEGVDLPPKMPSTVQTVPLGAEAWRLYKEMRDDSVVFLESGTCTAAQAGVRVLRLAQLCGGFLGGIQDFEGDGPPRKETRQVGREKLDDLAAWYDLQGHKVRFVIWTRFRAEAEAAAEVLRGKGANVHLLVGGQSKDERDAALRLLNPRTAAPAPCGVVGTVRTGAMGVDLQAADRAVYFSNDWSHVARSQSEDRIHRPGQTNTCYYWDFVATGPNGERTVEHDVLEALREKRSLAGIGAKEWARRLRG